MYDYKAVVTQVHDGDTFTAIVDLGFFVSTTQHFRLAGCNARELTQPGGPEAAVHLAQILSVSLTVTVSSVQVDKYGGRYDARITMPDGTDLVTTLIAEQWVAPWNGQGIKPVPPWPRTV